MRIGLMFLKSKSNQFLIQNSQVFKQFLNKMNSLMSFKLPRMSFSTKNCQKLTPHADLKPIILKTKSTIQEIALD